MEIINRAETVSLLEEKIDFVKPKGLHTSGFEVIVEY